MTDPHSGPGEVHTGRRYVDTLAGRSGETRRCTARQPWRSRRRWWGGGRSVAGGDAEVRACGQGAAAEGEAEGVVSVGAAVGPGDPGGRGGVATRAVAETSGSRPSEYSRERTTSPLPPLLAPGHFVACDSRKHTFPPSVLAQGVLLTKKP